MATKVIVIENCSQCPFDAELSKQWDCEKYKMEVTGR